MPSTGTRLRPVVAAGVVLLLWLAWLLVPVPAREALLGAPDQGAAQGAAQVSGAGAVADAERVAADQEPAGARPTAGVGAAAVADASPAAAPAGPAAAASAASAEASAPPSVGAPEPEPTPAAVPDSGSGSFDVAPGTGPRVGGSGTLVRYSVEVEGGVPLEPSAVARVVDAALADPRSWTGEGEWTLQRVDSDPDVRIRVASPDTTDALCAPLRTGGELSCRNGPDVALNALRWTRGARSWGDDVAGYREYLVNHELGHFLGYGHVGCPAEGDPAPVMLQQTLGLQGCAPNGWPFP